MDPSGDKSPTAQAQNVDYETCLALDQARDREKERLVLVAAAEAAAGAQAEAEARALVEVEAARIIALDTRQRAALDALPKMTQVDFKDRCETIKLFFTF